MNLINKRSIVVDDEIYFLLGIDNSNNKYYIRHVDTVNSIRRIDFIYIIEEDDISDVIDYNSYFDNLDRITYSTLSTKELDDLKGLLDHISQLKNAYKLAVHSSHGISVITSQPSKDIEMKHKLDLLQYYLQINSHFTKEIE